MHKKYWFLIILAVLIVDQATKTMALKYHMFLPFKVTDFFDLVLVWNKGISFGLFNNTNASEYFVYLNSAILGVVFWWLLKPAQENLRLQGAFILGGGIGNIIDRLLYEGVVDFICLHWKQYYWPSFNIADSAITLAVGHILWQSITVKNIKDHQQ